MRRGHPAVVLAVAALLALTGCGGSHGDRLEEGTKPAVVRVETSIAGLSATTDPVIVSGTVEPLVRVAPGTKLLGRVAEVAVDEGERVRRGQLLARVEDADLRAAIARAEATVEMARARQTNAEAQEARMTELRGRGSVTEKNLEDAVAALRVARASVLEAEAALAAARVDLDFARIESPIDGWVTAKRVERGGMTSPGQPMFVIDDLSRLKVAVEAGEEIVSQLAPGDLARVSIGSGPDDIEAQVHRIVPAGDPRSRTFTVRLLIDNPQGRIKPGMFARATFAGATREVLAVTEAALVRRGQLEGLFVVEEDIARLRWVRRGRTRDGKVEILSGLAAGERYVSSPPPAGLQDGSAVEEES